MSNRSAEFDETQPHSLDDRPWVPSAQGGARTFAGTIAGFFNKNAGTSARDSMVDKARQVRQALVAAPNSPGGAKSTLYRHWDAIQAEGITASEFIAFLQPLADLDGITVSYVYQDEDGAERVYNHRRGEFGTGNPLSRAIQEKKLSKEKALTFALNEEGRIWIESNFIELSELK